MTAIGFLVAKSVSWLRPITFRARLAGKLVTTLQLATLIAVLLRPEMVGGLITAVGIVAVIAVIDYTLLLWRERVRSPA
jgi:cardiolipin synthase (CMP-forming)